MTAAAALKSPVMERTAPPAELAPLLLDTPIDRAILADSRLPDPVAREIAARQRAAAPAAAVEPEVRPGAAAPHGAPTVGFLNAAFDQLDQDGALARIQAADPDEPFRYVSFLDAQRLDKVMREGAALSRRYADAWMTLCAGHGLALAARSAAGDRVPAVSITHLLRGLLRAASLYGDTVAVIGSDGPEMTRLIERYQFANLSWFNPPLYGRGAAKALHEAAQAVDRANARYTLLCLGWPYDEAVAQVCANRGYGRGVGICVGEELDRLAHESPRRRPAAPSVVDAANDALRELPTALGLWNRSQRMHARLRRAAAGIARDRVRLAEAAARAS
ncbi:MAG: WecB/TagA/CpsF family glycosyltransferase [Caulobacterales bacterium]|nr:WecB/TagA/CpsF family glycosyltransferase [Caulobacterales bacterium]